jgi:hypothetical protein
MASPKGKMSHGGMGKNPVNHRYSYQEMKNIIGNENGWIPI